MWQEGCLIEGCASVLLFPNALVTAGGPVWQRASGPSKPAHAPQSAQGGRRHSVFGRTSVEHLGGKKGTDSPRVLAGTPLPRTRAASYAGQTTVRGLQPCLSSDPSPATSHMLWARQALHVCWGGSMSRCRLGCLLRVCVWGGEVHGAVCAVLWCAVVVCLAGPLVTADTCARQPPAGQPCRVAAGGGGAGRAAADGVVRAAAAAAVLPGAAPGGVCDNTAPGVWLRLCFSVFLLPTWELYDCMALCGQHTLRKHASDSGNDCRPAGAAVPPCRSCLQPPSWRSTVQHSRCWTCPAWWR